MHCRTCRRERQRLQVRHIYTPNCIWVLFGHHVVPVFEESSFVAVHILSTLQIIDTAQASFRLGDYNYTQANGLL